MAVSYTKLLEQLIKLQNVDFTQTTNGLRDLLATVYNVSNNTQLLTSELSMAEAKVLGALADYENVINNLGTKLTAEFDSKTKDFIAMSEENWRENISQMTFEESFNWAPCWPPTGEEYDYFVTFVSVYSNWRHPSLILGAKHRRELIEAAMGSDPVYVVEHYSEYFDYQKTLFPVDMAKKFRFYGSHDLAFLPKQAIGLICVYNEFPFLPWKSTFQYITELAEKLSPGGHFIFNFNDCTTVKGMESFEKKLMTYTTPAMFEKVCNSVGMHLCKLYRSNSENFSFMVFEKPGEKNKTKANPSLGYVKMQDPRMFAIEEKQRRIEFIRNIISKN